MGRDAGQGVRPILDHLFGDLRCDLSELPKRDAMSIVTSLAKLNHFTFDRLAVLLEESGLRLSDELEAADLSDLMQILDQLCGEVSEERQRRCIEKIAVSMQTAFRLGGEVPPEQVLPLLSCSMSLRHIPRSDAWHRFLLQKLRSSGLSARPESVRAMTQVALMSPKSKDLCQMIPQLAQIITQILPQLSFDDFADFVTVSRKLGYRDDYTMDRILFTMRGRCDLDSRIGRLGLLRSMNKPRALMRTLRI